MGLVSYSDSEGSEDEQLAPKSDSAKARQSTNSTSSKSSFQKVVDRSGSNKIRVSLPATSDHSIKNDTSDNLERSAPPAKRARTDGGAFTGFNSFLPAPKKPSKQPGSSGVVNVGGGGLLRNKGGQLGGGVSLKTGSAPAFSREEQHEAVTESGSTESNIEPLVEKEQEHSSLLKNEQKPEVELVGNVNRFRPLSVSRKPTAKKKKKKSSSDAVQSTQSTLSADHDSHATVYSEPKTKPVTKEKRSLFSTAFDDTGPLTTEHSEAYEPTAADSNVPVTAPSSFQRDPTSDTQPGSAKADASQSNDLESLADNLGLSASERRQLFGRGGKPSNAQVAQFSLAAEYSHNNEMLQNESNAMPQHNPVRSIAPGKHSLQQLVNAANNQKDALEESFAEGKRNKAAAGKKYGW